MAGRMTIPGESAVEEIGATTAPPPPQTSKYYHQNRSGEARPQVPGRPVRKSQWNPTRYWLEPVRSREASEGSLSLTVAVSLDADLI